MDQKQERKRDSSFMSSLKLSVWIKHYIKRNLLFHPIKSKIKKSGSSDETLQYVSTYIFKLKLYVNVFAYENCNN